MSERAAAEGGSGHGAVVFDFDGTLADSMAEVLLAYNSIAPRRGVPTIDAERLSEFRKLGHRELLSRLDVPLWKVPGIMADVRGALRERMTELRPFPGIRELLVRLHDEDVAVYIVSSNARENIEAFRRCHDLPEFAGYRCGVSLLGKGVQLRRLIARERLQAAATYYVGDEVRDVVAAASAGMRSIAVSWGYSDPDALGRSSPDLLVTSPAQIATQVLTARDA